MDAKEKMTTALTQNNYQFQSPIKDNHAPLYNSIIFNSLRDGCGEYILRSSST